MQRLNELYLGSNEIQDEGAKYLADAVKNNTVVLIFLSFILYSHFKFFIQTLTIVDLNYNRIGPEGARYLADELKNNTVIFFSYYSSYVFIQIFPYRHSSY